jgi:hypothetical protein
MWSGRLRRKMLSMLLLLSQPLAAVRDEDASRAGHRPQITPRIPQRAALLDRVRGRRGARPRLAAHA